MGFFSDIVDNVTDVVGDVFGSTWAIVKDTAGLVWHTVSLQWGELSTDLQNILDDARGLVGEAVADLTEILTLIFGKLAELIGIEPDRRARRDVNKKVRAEFRRPSNKTRADLKRIEDTLPAAQKRY